MKLYRIFVALMIIFTFGISGVDLDKLPSYSTTFDKKINPHVSLSKALDKVKKTNKNILLFVGGDWCRCLEHLIIFWMIIQK